jgi:hypothetical protein
LKHMVRSHDRPTFAPTGLVTTLKFLVLDTLAIPLTRESDRMSLGTILRTSTGEGIDGECDQYMSRR